MRNTERCERFIVETVARGHQLIDHPGVDTDEDDVEQVRSKITKLKTDLAAMQERPVPLEVAKERLRVQIEALAQQSKPDIRALLSPEGGEIVFNETLTKANVIVGLGDGKTAEGVATGTLKTDVTWYVHRAAIRAQLEADLVEHYRNIEGIDDATRAREQAQLEQELLRSSARGCRTLSTRRHSN